MEKYNHKKIERKWQKAWEEAGIYRAEDKAKDKKNFYHLVMFPYPSGDLHVGHWYNFAPADVYARLKRMQGFNVMSPIGFDAFGLPAENAAIKRKIHPRAWTHKNIGNMRKQLKLMGNCFDWSREVITCEPDYYKWTQWMFLQLFKKGLAYRAKAPANWCSSCKTVLANEQVVDGKCERCDTVVVQREIAQWLFKITDYKEALLEDLKDLDWPEATVLMQKNWIGKSAGWEIEFDIKDAEDKVKVFTTRIDTLFGATYMVIAPEHPIVQKLADKIRNLERIKKYIQTTQEKTERERLILEKGKTGIEIQGIKAINPVNKREIPIFVADYVLMHYGTGAIMAVPSHDQRDFDFAKKYNLPIIEVVRGKNPEQSSLNKSSLVISDGLEEKAYEGEGILVNSDRFNGLKSEAARDRIGEWLARGGAAQKSVYYRLKDWLISRQRYWGAPIPVVCCGKCGIQPVPEKDLPVLLPNIKDYRPSGEGESPLANSRKFVETVCPKCGGPARRETDTMDTFVCSSWYYFRFTDACNDKEFASKEKIKTWLPVDIYIGGAEHTVLHLLYSRFFTKALKDLGYIDFKEPFPKLRHQGTILGPDNQKMSKSKGNVVDPDAQVDKYGADVVRIHLCFMGPYDQGGPWKTSGVVGACRFLNRVWKLANELIKSGFKEAKSDKDLERLSHQTIKKVSDDLENLRFNTAVSSLMILVNKMEKSQESVTKKQLEALLLLMAPLTPHITEELWSVLRGQKSGTLKPSNFIHSQQWPQYDEDFTIEEKILLIIQVNGKVRDKVEASPGITEKEAQKLALKQQKIREWIGNKKPRKIIFVKGKLVNIVV